MNVYIGSNIRLPSGYQEVEYIESSWTQYIDTQISAPNWFRWVLKVSAVESASASKTLIWTHNTSSPYWRNNINLFTQWNTWWLHMNDEMINWLWSITLWQIYDVDGSTILWASYLDVDWVRLTTWNNTSPMSSNNLLIFANQYEIYAGQVHLKAKLYSCKLYKDWTLVRDFIPCYRKSDNVIWMYDLVNDQFYTNSWTGTFIKGNDVTMTEVKNIYIGEYWWIPTDWLLAYYPLVEDANDHKADLWVTWTTYNWTWQGAAAYWTIWWKTAALFSRGSNRINTGVTMSSIPISLCATFYHTTNNDWETIIWNPNWNNGNWFALRYIGSANLIVITNGTWTEHDATASATSNVWHSVVMTIQSWATKVYLDWNLVYTLNSGNGWWSTFYIASYGTYTTYWWNWYIWDVCIYDKVLSEDEVAMYHQTVIN
jgi:hypothetical protein